MKAKPKAKPRTRTITKKKSNTIVIAIVILLLIIALLVYLDYTKWNILFKKKIVNETTVENRTIIHNNETVVISQKEYPYRLPVDVSEYKNSFPLQKGKGKKTFFVYSLQTALNKIYGANIDIDGDFGPLTEAALVKAKLPVKVYFKDFAKIWGRKDVPDWITV